MRCGAPKARASKNGAARGIDGRPEGWPGGLTTRVEARRGRRPPALAGGELVGSRARKSDGILFYDYEFSKPGETREAVTMCVHKQRLWQLSAKSPEKNWKKYEGIYRNVLGSFVPKL